MSSHTDDVAALRDQIATLNRRIEALESASAHDVQKPVDPRRPTTRRGAFRLAAGAATGAVAAAAISRPAAADDPNDVTLGTVKETGARPTGSRYTGASSGVGALFAAGTGASGTSAEFSAALGAWSQSDTMPNGLYGFSDQQASAGVVGKNETGAGGVGVRGVGKNYGVWGETRNDINSDDWGVIGIGGTAGVYGESRRDGVVGQSTQGFSGVRGEGATGGWFEGDTDGAVATGDRYGLVATGGLAAIRLTANSPTPPAMQGGPLRAAGELAMDALNDLWLCVGSGTPGTWRKVAGPGTGGTFHPIGPFRMYDSRVPAYPVNGKLDANTNREVDITDGRDEAGVVVQPDAIPSGASAVAINLTVTETEAPSFLAAAPGDATEFSSSSINWWRDGLSVANGLIVPLGPDRSLKFFAGPGGAVHFIVDVSGYWR